MAIYTLGEMFASLRGSIGGTTFSNNKAGLIAKRKVNGRKSYTTKQADVIKIQSFIVGQWQNLSLANQTLWDDYAALYPQIDRFGTTKNLSGFNWFTHMNNLKFPIDGIILTTPPARASAEIVPSFSVGLDYNDITINLDSPLNAPDNRLYIFASLMVQKTSSNNRGLHRLVHSVADPNFTNLVITHEWNSYYDIDYFLLQANSQFKLQVCMYLVNTNSWQNSVQVCGVGEYSYIEPVYRITEAGDNRET